MNAVYASVKSGKAPKLLYSRKPLRCCSKYSSGIVSPFGKPGKYFESGSLTESFPSCCNKRTAPAVNSLLTDASSKSVFASAANAPRVRLKT